MEIRVREFTIRGEKCFVVDSDGITQERKLKLILEAAYNSILTDPEFVEKIPYKRETRKSLENLKRAIEDFQSKTENQIYQKTG